MTKQEQILQLISQLNSACDAYYNGTEIMTNKQYDDLYDKLTQLEDETGIIYSNSVTQKVGYEVSSKLQKVKHETKMLSLDKTKDIQKLKSFLGDRTGLFSWKMDGCTTILTYDNGILQQATSRGNGDIGEDITANVKTFDNVPLTIPFKGKLKLRGESIITYSQFEKINSKILNLDDKYKNPRNLCSGAIRQLDNKICKERKPQLHIFEVIDGVDFKLKSCKLDFIESLGFSVVERILVDKTNVENYVQEFSDNVDSFDIPVDGLVITLDDVEYSKSLGATSHHNLDGIAYKFKDESQETTLLRVDFQPSRTGLINPVAIFQSVNIDGANIERASLHNLNIIEDLELGIGDTITIYRANMVIPQVEDNLTRSNTLEIPITCPSCGEPTEIKPTKTSKVLMCNNPNCQAKLITNFTHYVSRDCANIDGLSEATLEKFIEKGFLKRFSDIYSLAQYKDTIMKMDGFGKKSYDKLISSIEKSKSMNISNFIKALGIENVGNSTGKLIAKHFKNDVYKIFTYDYRLQDELAKIDGIGEITARAYALYLMKNQEEIIRLMEFVNFDVGTNMSSESSANVKDNPFKGCKLYATGTFANYKKEEIKKVIESLGAEFANGYAKSLNYLIVGSLKGSSKTDKAIKDGIPVLTEDKFIEMIKQ